MKFTDAITISGTRKRTEDGALIVDARAARTGIQIYAGSEVGRPDLSTVRVFRSADQVFHRDSLASFAHRPVTNDHPNEAVTADNWKDFAVGQTADEVTATDIYVRVPLMVSDAVAIADIEAGKRELSAGYTCDLDWTPGLTSKGETFDARQTNIRINHVAIVDRGRAGKECRIGDGTTNWGVGPLNHVIDNEGIKPMLKTITIDGLPIEITVPGEMVVNRLQADIATRDAKIAELNTSTATVVADKDAKIGELTAEVAKLKADAVTPAMLDKMVADRVELVGKARALVADVKIDGVTDADIRKAVVAASMGDDAVKDQNDAVIGGMFAVLAKDTKPATAADPFRAAMVDGAPSVKVNDNGQAAYEKRLRDAHKAPAGNA